MQVPNTSGSTDPLPAIQESFSGGMRDRDHPSILAPNEYARGVNIDIREEGSIGTRDGRTSKTVACGNNPQGGCWFEPLGGTGVMVQVNDGKFYYWTGSGTAWTRIGATQLSNRTSPVSFVVLNSRLFIFSGTADDVFSWDGVAAAMTDEGNTNTDPVLGDIACQQEGRICASGASSPGYDYFAVSDIFDGQTWARSTNNKRVPTNGSQAVTALVEYRKTGLITFTRNSCHIWDVSGSTVANFSRLLLDPTIGTPAMRSVVVVGDDCFFMSADKHIRTIKRTQQDLAFAVSMPISYYVPNLIGRINRTAMSGAAAIFFDNYYLISVPMDTETRNSATIAFDTLHQRLTPAGSAPVCVGEWTNIAANCWIKTAFNDIEQLYYIDANDGTAILMFDGETDDGDVPEALIEFRGQSWQLPNHPKTLHSGELQLTDSQGDLTLSYAKEDGVFVEHLTATIGDTTSGVLPIALPFSLAAGGVLAPIPVSFYGCGRSRYWQPKIEHEGGKINIKHIALRAWVEQAVTR